MAAEFGIPFLLLALTLVALGVRRFVVLIHGCNDPQQRLCGIGLFFACIAIAVDGFFSGNFVMPVSQTWIAFTLGWSLAWMRSQHASLNQQASATARHSWAWRLSIPFLLALQLWLVADIWPEAVDLDRYLQDTMMRFPSPTMNPRFWSHGWF